MHVRTFSRCVPAMSDAALTPPAPLPEIDPGAALEPLKSATRRWPLYLSGIISLLLLFGLGRELLSGGFNGLQEGLPTNPLFYVVFLLVYFTGPVVDYAIFRRLWGLPVSGIVPLLRKTVANEVLLGYSGEAYFYAWARSKLDMIAAPFAAIKDVSILSAVVGNVFTLILLGAASPFAFEMLPAELVKPVIWSAVIVISISMGILFFRGRIFSLERSELRWVFFAHIVRTLLYTGLLALCWHLALLEVPLAIWMLLVTSRALVSRLPLIPNKDIVFANLALLLVGRDNAVAHLVAITVALTLVCHAIVLVATWLPFLNRSET